MRGSNTRCLVPSRQTPFSLTATRPSARSRRRSWTSGGEIVVGDAIHWLIYEKNRGQLLREVQIFLEEADSPDPRRGAPER